MAPAPPLLVVTGDERGWLVHRTRRTRSSLTGTKRSRTPTGNRRRRSVHDLQHIQTAETPISARPAFGAQTTDALQVIASSRDFRVGVRAPQQPRMPRLQEPTRATGKSLRERALPLCRARSRDVHVQDATRCTLFGHSPRNCAKRRRYVRHRRARSTARETRLARPARVHCTAATAAARAVSSLSTHDPARTV
jgi:hypothetical protein